MKPDPPRSAPPISYVKQASTPTARRIRVADRLPRESAEFTNEKNELLDRPWRPEGCSDAITSSLDGWGHGSFSGFRSKRFLT